MSTNADPLQVEQCLFGYDDGHRLLAASSPLAPGDASRLLLASDLAPGLSDIAEEGYWTGIPLLEERRYALMRTWPAPEISRPGCVWTHVLRISFADISRPPDLAVLKAAFRRPHVSETHDTYRTVLAVQPEFPGSEVRRSDDDTASDTALLLLRSVYSGSRGKLLPRMSGIDEITFALWSQQWPRLRRSFGFRTAVGLHGSPRELRLHVQILSGQYPKLHDSELRPSPWESVAIEDMLSADATEFRRFIWRYGSDVVNGFDSFSVLARIFCSISVPRLEGELQRQLLELASEIFPKEDDAALLKADLTAMSANEYSRIPAVDSLGVWGFLVESSGRSSFKMPALVPEAELNRGFDSRSEVIRGITDTALRKPSPAGDAFFESVCNALTPVTFWQVMGPRQSLMQAVAVRRPELLDNAKTASMPAELLLNLLRDVTLDERLAARIVPRLSVVSSSAIALLMFSKHKDVVIDSVLDGLASHQKPALAWLELVQREAQAWLTPEILNRAREKGALRELINYCDPLSVSVISAGTQGWASVVANLQFSEGHVPVFAYALIVALQVQGQYSERVFEHAFEVVYLGIARRSVPTQIVDVLARILPSVPRWKEWDKCYRLTFGVAHWYVENRRSPWNLAQGIADRYIRRRFLKLVSKIESGDREFDDDGDRD